MAIGWALLPSAQAGVAEPPRATMALADGGQISFLPVVAGDADYPFAARRAEIKGTSNLYLTVETDGAVSICRIIATAGHPDLDRKACELWGERADFKLLDRTKPVVVGARVRWMLQD